MTHEDPHARSADAVHEGRPVEAQYVRQGRGGVRIVLLLVVSAVLAAAGLFAVWALWSGGLASTGARGDQAVGARAFEGDGPAPKAQGEARPAAP